MTVVAGSDPALGGRLDGAGPVLLDIGCGDGRHTVRWAERRPDALVVGLDAETTRWGRALTAARRRKLRVVFVGAAVERPPTVLLGRAAELAVVMPWGSLLDGILGADPAVLRAVLALGAPGATLDAVVNVRPWDAPASVDRKLAATPEPTAEHLAGLAGAYAELGWTLAPVGWLTDAEARALGSTWASRVVAARASRLLRLRAAASSPAGPDGLPGPGGGGDGSAGAWTGAAAGPGGAVAGPGGAAAGSGGVVAGSGGAVAGPGGAAAGPGGAVAGSGVVAGPGGPAAGPGGAAAGSGGVVAGSGGAAAGPGGEGR